jgi:L-alanine-DL-glutamate epimerase-like enolase superfamily enzyme
VNGHNDVRVTGVALYFIPIKNRVPLKFGLETTTSVTLARVRIDVERADGKRATGWGETPLSVHWVWPGTIPYEERHGVMKDFTIRLAEEWNKNGSDRGHAFEIGHRFIEEKLPVALKELNEGRKGKEAFPWLGALVCCSPFDLALHDAYGKVNERPVFETFGAEFLNADLATYLGKEFAGKYPEDFLLSRPPRIMAWHLVGGKDAVSADELDGSEPKDGYPVLLEDWIKRDGLKCLKIKLRGNDAAWDYARTVEVGRLAIANDVWWLSADFNCTVHDPEYVNEILDRLMRDEPRIFGMILYVEQPFPYELEEHRIDVRSVSARKPLFMDESAHDWKVVRLGRELGWTGVALKTCKTLTGALLSLCYAKRNGMTLMVQDLTNPTLAQVPHVLLAAHAGTIMGVETNSMQFYPEASKFEAQFHPGLYQRREGRVDLRTIQGNGFGYGEGMLKRELPEAVFSSQGG